MKRVMTWDRLQEMIRSGAGQGHGETYRPFIQIHRSNSSSKGNQTVGPLPGQQRSFHGLARLERQLGILCYWLGAQDVREQFPMWPFPHRHPIVGARSARSYPRSKVPGLLQIAGEAGVDHGVFVGTNIPYVATLDVVATVNGASGPYLVAFSCKPRKAVLEACSTSRILERLELERSYCDRIAAGYHIAHELALPPDLIKNLENCGAAWARQKEIAAAIRFDEFRSVLLAKLKSMSIRCAVERAIEVSRIDPSVAWPAFRLLCWTLEIDVDLSKPQHHSYRMVPGGRELHARLTQTLFGGGSR